MVCSMVEDDEVVTPEMIQAGVVAFGGYHPDFEDIRDRLEYVYLCMRDAAPEAPAQKAGACLSGHDLASV